jgi:hypothetical protein
VCVCVCVCACVLVCAFVRVCRVRRIPCLVCFVLCEEEAFTQKEETCIQEKERHETCRQEKREERREKTEDRRENRVAYTHHTVTDTHGSLGAVHAPTEYLRDLSACFPDTAYVPDLTVTHSVCASPLSHPLWRAHAASSSTPTHMCARIMQIRADADTQSICLSSVWCVHTPYTCRVCDIHHTHAEDVTHLPDLCVSLGHGTCTSAAASAKVRGAKQPWTCGRAGARKRERALDRERARTLHGEREREECCARVAACVRGVFWGVSMCVRVHRVCSRFWCRIVAPATNAGNRSSVLE